jgi:hypothetical protein
MHCAPLRVVHKSIFPDSTRLADPEKNRPNPVQSNAICRDWRIQGICNRLRFKEKIEVY